MATEERDTAGNDPKDIIEILSKHQDQQSKFVDMMEGIRWKFSTAFGVGIVAAIIFALASNPSLNDVKGRIEAGLSLVIIISIASLITQIRIHGLMRCAWKRIIDLQVMEVEEIHREYGQRPMKPFLHPPVDPGRSAISKLLISHLTVHMANCLVFAGFIGAAIGMLVNGLYGYDPALCGGASGVSAYVLSWLLSAWYVKLLMNHEEKEKSPP